MGKQTRNRKAKADPEIKLAQPDRSGPTEETLLQFAQERNLFDQADRDPRNKANKKKIKKQKIKTSDGSDDESSDDEDDEDSLASPTAERIMETVLWTVSLSMTHLTFDLLVQYQYGMDMDVGAVLLRSGEAFLLFCVLFYVLHEHSSNPILLPGLPIRYQGILREAIFFVMGIVSGCYLIYITNNFGYLAVLKRAPTLGCLWVWSVIELHLIPAVVSVAVCGLFFWAGDYSMA